MTINQWSKHYQSVWEERAANQGLPLWVRVFSLAYGTHAANGHATFQRGDLKLIMGRMVDGEFVPGRSDSIRNAINLAVREGFLEQGSCAECLIVPGHAIEKSYGNVNAPCRVHQRKRAQARRNRVTAVA